MKPLDLAVVGGGITGLGVARLAARNGLSVVVIERADLASGASSATSHMLHGGLRYLENAHVGLVREALAERAAVSRMAPSLVKPTRFLVPFYRGDRRAPWMVRTGLTLYDALAGRANLAPHAAAGAGGTLALEPGLEPRHLRGAALYSDAVMDDAGLVVAVARDAAMHGAEIRTYTKLIGARPGADGAVELIARDVLDSVERRWTARLVVNAAGAWADAVRILLSRALAPGSPDPRPLLRPSRGAHLIYPTLTGGHGLLLFARADGRVFFVIPFGAHSLVGTTETEVTSPPASHALRPDPEEIAYLRAELARVLPGPSRQPPLALTSGLRPLLASDGGVGQASREHRVVEEGPVLTVVGGKYTTFRVMARDALERAKARLGRAALIFRDEPAPLPAPPPGERSPQAIAAHAVEHEFARRIGDVMRRRSRLWLSPDRGRVAALEVTATLAQQLGWSAARTRHELDEFHSELDREEHLLHGPREAAWTTDS